MSLPDSTWKPVDKSGMKVNPLRSRSTVICAGCLATLFGLNWLAWKAGFYSSEFALISVYIIKEIMVSVVAHQVKADGMDLGSLSIQSTTTTSPAKIS